MTRINQSALPYITLVNGFHFLKDQPSESHVFVQATSSSLSRLYKSDNTAVVPNNDTFSNVATLENNNPVFFSDAPNGAMVACNGASNRIWEGKEGRCSSFIVYDPNGTFWYDYTEIIPCRTRQMSHVCLVQEAA
jgi:hypothetical protein